MKLIYTTISTEDEAQALASTLLQKGLVGCVNILPNITSLYQWKGELTEEQELTLILKTTEEKAEEAFAEIEKIHPYTTPAIFVLDVEKVSGAYHSWIKESCK